MTVTTKPGGGGDPGSGEEGGQSEVKKDLLVCIAHHSTPGRGQYLATILKAFATEYKLTLDIIIDTQRPDVRIDPADIYGAITTVVSHVSLEHPFHLAWCHRRHMWDRIEDYSWFMYIEDDIYLPFATFDHYRTRFELLWPDFIPGFVRVEKHEGEEYAVDVTERQPCVPVRTNHAALKQPYHGFWIMPQRALKETMRGDFVRVSDSREMAASYPMWELGKTALVQIDGGERFSSDASERVRFQVIPECFAYHLPNGYAACPESPFGKIKVSEIFL
jgi:hypothetical protein